MATSEVETIFCKYCGSLNLIDVDLSKNASKKRHIEPQGQISYDDGTGTFKAEASVSSHFGSEKGITITYKTKFCELCQNVHVVDQCVIHRPIEIVSSSSRISVLIPYALYTYLYSHGYKAEDFSDMVMQIRGKLDKIEAKWGKHGSIPCNCGKRGYKLKITTIIGRKIETWVIIDSHNAKLVYRLTYGGAKDVCG